MRRIKSSGHHHSLSLVMRFQCQRFRKLRQTEIAWKGSPRRSRAPGKERDRQNCEGEKNAPSSLGFASRWNDLTTKYTREQAPRQFREEITVDSPVGWWLRESLVVTFCLHPEKGSGSSAIRAGEFSDRKRDCPLTGRQG